MHAGLGTRLRGGPASGAAGAITLANPPQPARQRRLPTSSLSRRRGTKDLQEYRKERALPCEEEANSGEAGRSSSRRCRRCRLPAASRRSGYLARNLSQMSLHDPFIAPGSRTLLKGMPARGEACIIVL